jgi:hypothetical protein
VRMSEMPLSWRRLGDGEKPAGGVVAVTRAP